jgi:dihydrodipicolinate reductase
MVFGDGGKAGAAAVERASNDSNVTLQSSLQPSACQFRMADATKVS